MGVRKKLNSFLNVSNSINKWKQLPVKKYFKKIISDKQKQVISSLIG